MCRCYGSSEMQVYVCVCVSVCVLFLAPGGPYTMRKLRKAGWLAANSVIAVSQTCRSTLCVTPAAMCKIYYYGYL